MWYINWNSNKKDRIREISVKLKENIAFTILKAMIEDKATKSIILYKRFSWLIICMQVMENFH